MASDPPPRRKTPPPLRRHRALPSPPGTSTVGMWLFLASVFMLFASAMLCYVLIRHLAASHGKAGSLHFPWLLWVSTPLVLLVSGAMVGAVSAIRIQRLGEFSFWLWAAMGASLAFLVVQTPAMIQLVLDAKHQWEVTATGRLPYGLVFCLILLHALHVLGGLVALVWITYRANRGAYDHEHFAPIRNTALYWHFIDVIWVMMFAMFLVTA
jgi:heme/copper-type cytochrome/quinol oxidase subunit 3